MPGFRRTTRGFGVVGAVLLAGCSFDDMVGPLTGGDASPVTPGSPAASELVCHTITFDEEGLAHGGQVTSIGLPGMTIGFSVVPYVPGFGYRGTAPAGALRIFDTNNQTHPEDDDFMVPPAGHCAQCLGQDNVMVIEHERGFASDGDYRWGGAITLSGIAEGYYVRSFKVFDNEACREFPPVEATIRLLVGGELVGESSNQGTGTVERVDATKVKPTPGSVVFTFGTEAQDAIGGSSALDDVVLCRRM